MSYSPTEYTLGFAASEIDKVTAELGNNSVTNPWTRAISEGIDLIDTYAANYTLTDAMHSRLLRPIVIHDLYQLMHAETDQQKAAYDAAIKELEQVRDGKVPLALKSPLPALNTSGIMSSDDIIDMVMQ